MNSQVVPSLSSAKRRRVLVGLLLFAAGTEFVIRGPLRALRTGSEFNDFMSPYIQARLWLSGEDPYDPAVFASRWPSDIHKPDFVSREAVAGSLAARRGIPSPYPISALSLIVPFTAMPWHVANVIWIAIETLCFAIFVAGLVKITQAESAITASGLIATAMVLAPFHTAFATENIVVVVMALLMVALLCWMRKQHRLSGLALACAIALKPTAALSLLLFFTVRQAWGVLLPATTALALLLAASAGRLALSGVHWFSSFARTSELMFSSGAINDFSGANSLRFDLVNIQVVISQVVRNRSLTQWLAILLGILGLSAWLRLRARTSERSVLLDLACASTLTLAPFYHRSYDAALLMFCVAWAFATLKQRPSRCARLTILAAVPFLVPGASFMRWVSQSTPTFAVWSQSWWWTGLLASHQVWMVLIILATLFAAHGSLPAKEPTLAAEAELAA